MIPRLFPPSNRILDPPPEPTGQPSAWDGALGFHDYTDSPLIRPPLPEETPYRVVYRDQTYAFRATLTEEGDEYSPQLDLVIPYTRMHGKLPVGTKAPFTGSVLVYHVSNKGKQIPMRITAYVEINDVVELNLWTYGSILSLGPVVDWPEPEDSVTAKPLTKEELEAKLLQGNQTVV